MIDLAKELEEKGWAAPASTNSTDPYGVPYFIVKNATVGFTGGNPAGNTSTAGIDRTTVTTYKNYSAPYVNITKDDLIAKLRTFFRKAHWKSPAKINDFMTQANARFVLYTNDAVITELETVGEQQNENLGRDLARFGVQTEPSVQDELLLRRWPMRYVPKLDDDTAKPIYMIDHRVFYVFVLEGDFLRESPTLTAPNQHNTLAVWTDLTYNYGCVDPRRCGVAYVA